MSAFADTFTALEAQSATWDEAEAPATVTIDGIDYLAAVVPGRDEQRDTSRGYEWHQTVRIDIRKSLLPTAPVRDTAIRFNGHEWKVRFLYTDVPGAQQWAINCTRRIGS